MDKLKFTIIKTQEQYNNYCNILENLVTEDKNQDEIELLTLLIEKWDQENNSLSDSNPVELIKSLMDEHKLKAKDLAALLGLSKGTVSKLLNYQKGLSKNTIRILASHFKISQEAFNRPYKLKVKANKAYKNASFMNTKKKMEKSSA